MSKARRSGYGSRTAWLAIFCLPLIVLGGCGGGGSSSGSGSSSSASSGSSGSSSGSATAYYHIGGTITGLAGGGLVLQDNGSDNLSVGANGNFTFTTTVADGGSYDVKVATQPTSPNQFCNVYDHVGSVFGTDVTSVSVQCVTGLYNVVDTHQSTCYDSTTGNAIACNGTGYDADYAGNQPSYTVSADGKMVTDNVTGLIWTQTPDTNGDGVVNADDKMLQPDAVKYCASLNYGGFTWRLPSIKELFSLIDYRGTDPSSYTGTDTSVLTPFIDPSVFTPAYGDLSAGERIIDGQFATTTMYTSPLGTISGAATMFGVNFADGRIKGYPYDYPINNPKKFYVLCVTGNTHYGVNDFVDNGDQTVSDQATGLMWQKNDHHSTNFDDAVSYCQNATTGGYSDWRLPNAKELQSILDYDRSPDATDSAAIDPVFNATSFTNEDGQKDWGYYWSSTTYLNYSSCTYFFGPGCAGSSFLGSGTDAAYASFGRALGYFQSSLVDVHGAGALRSNDKTNIAPAGSATANVGYGVFHYKGPQGDVLRIDNMVRCVRGR